MSRPELRSSFSCSLFAFADVKNGVLKGRDVSPTNTADIELSLLSFPEELEKISKKFMDAFCYV